MTEETLVGEQTSTEANTTTESTTETKTTTEESDSLVGGSSADETNEAPKGDEKVEDKQEQKEEEINYDFKLPEGVVLDEEFVGEFKNVAKEMKLNQEQAQKLVDLQTKFTQTHAAKIDATFKATVNQWKEESIAELGANHKQEMVKVAKAMDSFGSPEFRKLLNETGLGNHKEVVKFFRNIGNKISEDSFKDGNRKAVEKTLAEKHYPNTKS